MICTHWLVATSAPTFPASQASGKNVSHVKPGGSNAGITTGALERTDRLATLGMAQGLPAGVDRRVGARPDRRPRRRLGTRPDHPPAAVRATRAARTARTAR